jgi:HSP20 family protein
MALPTRPASSWLGGNGLPSRLFETGRNDYELYEDEDEFVLSVELPGFDPADIEVTWDGGILNVAAEQEDEDRGEVKTYHRRFRFPKRIVDEEITAEYDNGILEVRLPLETPATVSGKQIEVQA